MGDEEVKEPEIPKQDKGRVRRAVEKLPAMLRPPARFLGQILVSGIKTIGSFFLIIIFFSLIGGIFGSLGGKPNREVVVSGQGPNKIVVIPLLGIILTQPESFAGASGTITPEKVQEALKHAQGDENIKGVVLELDSPGGSAVASDRIFDIIVNFKKETGKPIVALLGDTVASGGYYVAASADKIVANPATLTGSIGVIATAFNLEELMAKLGIKEEVFKKGEFKDILSATREITDEEKEIIESILDDAYQQFIDKVAEGRHASRQRITEVANGRIFSGLQAKGVGLVDVLGNLDEAAKEVKQLAKIEEAQVVRLQTGGLFEQLFAGISVGWLARFFPISTTPKVWYLMQ